MKIIFAGSHSFAIPVLTALLNSTHQIVAVYTQPDRPAGRGQKLHANLIKQIAQDNNITVYQPRTLRDVNEQTTLKNLNADVMIVVAYGMILPKAVLEIPRYGCINVHPSLLPRWRGASPIIHAVLAGDEITGVTIMQMNEGLDTGDILKQRSYPIAAAETTQTLQNKLSNLGAELLLMTLTELSDGKIKPIKQDESRATYAHKIDKKAAKINWQESAKILDCKIRAFNPWPVASTEFFDKSLRIWLSQALPNKTNLTQGTLVSATKEGIDVATDDGILRLLQVQLPGGKIITAADFLNANQQQLISGKTKFS